jgi:hypothetical protein
MLLDNRWLGLGIKTGNEHVNAKYLLNYRQFPTKTKAPQ